MSEHIPQTADTGLSKQASGHQQLPGATQPASGLGRRTLAGVITLVFIAGAGTGAGVHALAGQSDRPDLGGAPNGQRGPGGPMQGQNGLSGTVSAVTDTGFTLTADDGEWQVTVDSDTQYGGPDGGLTKSDITTGTEVNVLGQKDSSAKTVTARRIMQAMAGQTDDEPSSSGT